MIERWQPNVPGASLCSMKVGGSVAWVSRPSSREEIEEDLRQAGEQGLPAVLLGAGSDVLLSDEGLEALVIIPATRTTEVIGEISFPEPPLPTTNERYRVESGKGFLELQEKSLEGSEYVWVRIGAGVPWGQLVMWSLGQGLLGLQWFARIPCAVGGAVYNNIHGEKRFFSEVVQEVISFSLERGWVHRLPSELDFAYDQSIFHQHKDEVIWEVVLRLRKGSPEEVAEAKAQYIEWTQAKTEKQPSGANSGSVFQNLSPEEPVVAETGMVAAGWYVDHAGCLGWSEGGMQVYPVHGNFITNTGEGTQEQFITLVERVRTHVYATYHVWLKPEVICIMRDSKERAWLMS
jgi:UDP-N-acetylmuramate dehydrogenase